MIHYSMEYVYIPLTKEVRNKIRSFKSSSSYTEYLDRLMRVGSK